MLYSRPLAFLDGCPTWNDGLKWLTISSDLVVSSIC